MFSEHVNTNHDLKIALLLTGKTTSSMLCFPYIYESFLNTELNVDTFIHTWENSRIINLYNPKLYEIEQKHPNDIINQYLEKIKITDEIKVEGNIPNNILQFYTNKRGFDLIPNNYDYVIRCRFDVIFQTKINLKQIINNIENKMYDVYCPDEIFNFGGYQDRIYIGKYESIKNGINILDNLNTTLKKIKRWHPESFLKENWDSTCTRVFQSNINHRLVRGIKLETNWPENPYNYLNL